jgi:hypothetical protein
MNSTIESNSGTINNSAWKLNALDRCDLCSSQAFIKAEGQAGSLYFCGHHYNKIIKNSSGYANLMKFAFNIVDEREKLKER